VRISKPTPQSTIRHAAIIGAFFALGFSAASAERVGLQFFDGDDALSVALPTAITRALESIDGVVAPPPVEITGYIQRKPQDEAKINDLFALDALVAGEVTGAVGDYTLKLTITRGGKNADVIVKGKDFAGLVVAADAALIKALGFKASSDDLAQMAAVEKGLPSLEIANAASRATDAKSVPVLEKAADNAWAQAVLGLLLAQTSKPADGIPFAQKAVRLAPLDVNVQVMSAATQLLASKPADAKPLLDAALKLNPAKPEAHYISGLVKLRTAPSVTQDVLKDAGASFLRALQYNPRFLEAGLGLVDAQVKLGNPKGAQQTILSMVSRLSDEVRLHERMIGLLMQSDKDNAVEYLRQVVRQFPDVPDTVYALGTRLLDTSAALGIVQAGDAKYPKSALLAFSSGSLLERQGKYEDAAKVYRTALGRDAALERAGLALAACLSKLGRFDESEAALAATQAGKSNPKTKVRMYLQSGRLERATTALAGLNAATDAEVPYLQGVLALREGRFDDAQKSFQASLKAQPDYPQPKLALGELDEARRIGLPKLTGDAQFRYRLGQAAMDSGSPLEAVVAFQAALKAAPNTPQASFLLGVALFESGETDDAVTAFQAALKGLPNNTVVLTNIGAAYLEIGRFDLALDNLNGATKADGKYARGWYYLGIVNFQLGYAAPAKDAFLKAVALDSGLKNEIQPYLNSLK
jgi:tetratricopeptide (TPR) repeat protein